MVLEYFVWNKNKAAQSAAQEICKLAKPLSCKSCSVHKQQTLIADAFQAANSNQLHRQVARPASNKAASLVSSS
jgi:hypothetical protein